LNEEKIEYLIVGGYAVAFHGAPRATGDIDILIRPEHEQVPGATIRAVVRLENQQRTADLAKERRDLDSSRSLVI
jgi:hypothetical protein